ncbi:hypothetical protein ACEUBW_04480, partial [Aeromonas veronii]
MIDPGTYLDLIIANLGLGQKLIVVAVIHDGDDRGRGSRDVDAVTLGVGGSGAVAGRIGGGDFGVDGLVAVRDQVSARYV